MGPLAVEGSTVRPPWVIRMRPAATRRRAAARAGSMGLAGEGLPDFGVGGGARGGLGLGGDGAGGLGGADGFVAAAGGEQVENRVFEGAVLIGGLVVAAAVGAEADGVPIALPLFSPLDLPAAGGAGLWRVLGGGGGSVGAVGHEGRGILGLAMGYRLGFDALRRLAVRRGGGLRDRRSLHCASLRSSSHCVRGAVGGDRACARRARQRRGQR